MGATELRSVEKWFGETRVTHGVDLEIGDGEFVIFVGPSGCGKSTLLRMIGGLEETSRGSIVIDGRDVTADPPSKRGLAMVFQSCALYPHMSVRESMGFGLKTAGAPRSEIEAKVARAARALKLEDFLDRRPKALSGGAAPAGRRRPLDRARPHGVLVRRAAVQPRRTLRVKMRYAIAKLHQSLDTTMIYVTHDQVEAMTLADRIVVLEFGRIAQAGTLRELYGRPAGLFVAQFIGLPAMNVRSPAEVRPRGVEAPPEAVSMGVRPEHVRLVPPGEGSLDASVDVLECLGADSFVIADARPAGRITVRADETAGLRPGEAVGLALDPARMHLFDAEGRALGAG